MATDVTFPMTRKCPVSSRELPGPPTEYERLRRADEPAQVTLFDGRKATFLTRYEDVKALLTCPAVSSDRTHPDFPRWRPTPPLMKDASTSLVAMDDPEHGIHRKIVASEFTFKRVTAMRPRIQQIADQAVGNMLASGSPADFVQTVALAIPSLTICELLGVPYSDHEFFQEQTERMHRTDDPDASREGLLALYGYVEDLVCATSDNEPEEGLISRLRDQYVKTGELSEAGLAGLGFLMLVAGHETTSNMLALSAMTLMADRTKLRVVQDGPSRLPGVIEELLRYYTITDRVTGRLVAEDVELDGRRYRSGEPVIVSAMAANFDPNVFEDPEKLDIDRNPRNHLTFSVGKHSCLGQNLARAELEIGLETVFRRVPDLSLAEPVDGLKFKYDEINFGLKELPVAW